MARPALTRGESASPKLKRDGALLERVAVALAEKKPFLKGLFTRRDG